MTMCVNDNIEILYNRTQNNRASVLSNGHNTPPHYPEKKEDKVSNKQKIGVRTGTVLGIAASLAILAKQKKYSLNPERILNTKIKDTYMMKTPYKSKEIISIGAGSCIGGLIGGSIFDKKENFNSKVREAIVQMTNISLPILFVEGLSLAGKQVEEKMPDWLKSGNILKKAVAKLPSFAGAMVGLASGMYIGNKLSNEVNHKIFHKKDERPVKISDFSAHIDDICVAATFVAEKNILTKVVSRFIPFALFVAGNEVGTKQERIK